MHEETLAALQRKLGDAIVGSEVTDSDLCIRVDAASWRAAGEACRDLGFTYFCFLSGIDWLPNPGLAAEKVWDPDAPTEDGDEPTEMITGVAGGETRFQVFARLYDTKRAVGVTLKADLDVSAPSVDTWTTIFGGADWHERETWEMYGFDFVGHPGLRHLYLPSEFEGYPLRKDFPLLARDVKPWPGLVDVEPMPGEPEGEGGDEEGAEAEATAE